MNKLTAMKAMIVIFVFGLSCSTAFGELDPLEMYDDFNTKKIGACKSCIDTSKWRGAERGDYVGEIQRKIKSKRAYFSMRSWGNDSEDEGSTDGRNRLIFKNDPGSISGVCFTPRVKKFKFSQCESNPDGSNSVRIRYFGSMYNSDIGDVYAAFQFRHTSSDDDNRVLKKSQFRAYGSAWQCGDDDCNTDGWASYKTEADLDFGAFKKSNRTEFCVGYDSDNHELVFSAGDVVRTVDGPTNGLPENVGDVDPDRVFHVIEVRIDAENCQTDGMVSSYLVGDVDNVKIRRRP
jgi:hypothetical protein